MSDADENPGTSAESRVRDKPAIGIAAPTDSNAIGGAILRAQRHDHYVFVLVENREESEAARFAEELGASVVTPASRMSDGDRLEHLRSVARRQGFPGVIYHDDPTRQIDYDRSTDALQNRENYLVRAPIRATVDADGGVLVAIPAYNEEESIRDVVEEARKHADDVLVVDDGSDDDTAAKARQAGATVVQHDHNKQYGAALKTAFREAERSSAEHLVILDGDGQHDPTDVPRLVETQRDTGAPIVIGSRFGEASDTDLPRYRWIGVMGVNVLANLSFGAVRPSSWVRDTQSGFRVYDRQAIESLAEDGEIGNDMGASTDILHHAHRHDYEIEEVGTTVDYTVDNASTLNPVAHGVRIVMNLVHTVESERPVTVLGIPGLLSILMGLGFGYWTFTNYIASGVFPLGLAVTATFFALAGVFASFTAIILHSLATQLRD